MSTDPTDILLQRSYYERTAACYHDQHVNRFDEHARALAMFCGFARLLEHSSFLDVGAGTGRAARLIKEAFPDARVVGVEPVEALRTAAKQIGPLEGIELLDGDAQNLAFEANSFDWVIETGVLHHVRDFKRATEEMCRVAKVGVLISDSNNIGQGKAPVRTLKRVIKGFGLWRPFVFLQTRGRMYKSSVGDGIFCSVCAFDCIKIIKKKFPNISLVNTAPSGSNLYASAPQVAIIAWK